MKYTIWFMIHLVLGLWLFVSPFFLDFADRSGAFWNAIILGLLFVCTSASGLYSDHDELSDQRMSRRADKPQK